MPTSDFVVGLPPDLFTFTPPASPGYSTGNKPSPYHRALTPTEMTEVEVPDIQSQLLSAISEGPGQQGTPSLCHSSSSPVAEVVSFDFSSVNDQGLSIGGQRVSLGGKESNNSGFDDFFDYGNMGMEGGQENFFNL
jgi:hypothetical protein